MDGLRERVLAAIQSGFPLETDPYGVMAERLGAPREDVLAAVGALRADGTIRRLGASFSSTKLGYASTLCALSVPGGADALDAAAAVVDSFPNVTHDYARDDARYNLWFTLIARDAAEKERILEEVRLRTGCDDLLDLPATALYKIRVDFGDMGERTPETSLRHPSTLNGEASSRRPAAWGAAAAAAPCHPERSAEGAESKDPPAAGAFPTPFDPSDSFDRALVRWVQEDIAGKGAARPVDPEPFAAAAVAIAGATGDGHVDERRVIQRLRELKACGAIRRFGAMVAHRKAGFTFNGMTVWDVADAETDQVGKLFASFPFVSHCYARPRSAAWPYNLYAMVHGRTRVELDERVALLESAAGLKAKVLVSTREYKKTSMRYFVEDAASGLRGIPPFEEEKQTCERVESVDGYSQPANSSKLGNIR